MIMLLRMTFSAAAIGLAVGASGCSSPAPASMASTAQADQCINPTRIRKQEIVSDREIRFEVDNGDVWINTLKRDCNGLKFEGGFSWDVRGTQVCSNEQIITVLNAGNICQLGEFTKAPATPA